MKKNGLFLSILFVFYCSFILSAQKPVEIQLMKSDLFGNVSKVVEGRLFGYEEWGEMKYKMDTSKVSWYDASGRKVLSMSNNVVCRYSYRSDGKIESISYSPRNIRGTMRDGQCFGKLDLILPSICSDIYNYSPDGRLISIELRNPVIDGIRQYDLRSDLFYDRCIDAPYECEDFVFAECYPYEKTAKIIFKYAPDESYQVIMCDETGATLRKTEVSSDGHVVLNSWGVCEYDSSGRLHSWGGEIRANNGVGKWNYMLGYDSKGNLAIQTGKEDLVKDVDAVPWIKEGANYYGATVFEYKFDVQGNWTERIEYEIKYDGKKSEREMWGRIIEYNKYLDINKLDQLGEDVIEKNKAAEAQYVVLRFRDRFLSDLNVFTTDVEGNPIYDIEKIIATYKQYQKALQNYQKDLDGWSQSERKTKYKEIQTLGSQLYALMDITPNSSNTNRQWYSWLAVIWSEYIESGDAIPSNYYVALDAVEKLSEIEGNRSSIVYNALAYFFFYLLDDDALSRKGLAKGQAYKFNNAGLEMETKVWSVDMLLPLADNDFPSDFELKIQEYQREFKEINKLRDDYYPL